MDGTEHRAVAVQFPEFRKFGEELRLGNFLQDRFAEVAGDLLHLGRDRRVVRGQVRVGAFRIGDAEAVAEGAEVGVDPAHLRVRCVRKVDGHEVSDRAGHLVKEAAGFAKVLVLRHLRGFRHFNGRDRIVVVKTGEDSAEQHFKSCGRRHAGALQDFRGRVGVEAADSIACLCERAGHAADERFRRALLPRDRVQFFEVDLIERIAFRLHRDDAVDPFADDRDDIEVQGTRQHFAALVVRMVAAHFASAGSAEEFDRSIAKEFPELVQSMQVPAALCLQFRLVDIERPYRFEEVRGGDVTAPLRNVSCCHLILHTRSGGSHASSRRSR